MKCIFFKSVKKSILFHEEYAHFVGEYMLVIRWILCSDLLMEEDGFHKIGLIF